MNQWGNEGSTCHSLFTHNRLWAFFCLVQRQGRVYPATTGDEPPRGSTTNDSNLTIYVQRPVLKSYVFDSSAPKMVIRANRPCQSNRPGRLVVDFHYQIFRIASGGINPVDEVATCSAYDCFDNRCSINQTLTNCSMLRGKNPVVVYAKPPIKRPRTWSRCY